MNTLLLDTEAWDLCVDANGNIAMATTPYAYLQDAASVCRVWLGEYYYNTQIGIPYLQLLGITPIPFSQIQSELVDNALGVPGIPDNIRLVIGSVIDRRLVAQLQAKQPDGTTLALSFTVARPQRLVTDDGIPVVTNNGSNIVTGNPS